MMGDVEGIRPTGRTICIFGVYLVLAIGLSVVLSIVSKVPPNTGMRVAISLVAAVLAGQHFAKSFGSPPVGVEIRNLVLGSLAAMYLLGVVVALGVLTATGVGFMEFVKAMEVDKISPFVIFAFFLAASVFYGVLLWIAYGPLTRWMFNRSKTS